MGTIRGCCLEERREKEEYDATQAVDRATIKGHESGIELIW